MTALTTRQPLQQAITDHVGTGRMLFLPHGVYQLSRPLEWKNVDGLWRPRLILQGESREKTILRVVDHAAAFSRADQPAAVLSTGSMQQGNDAPDGGGNKAYGNYIFNLSIDTGKGQSRGDGYRVGQ
jgi:hypothetical protein